MDSSSSALEKELASLEEQRIQKEQECFEVKAKLEKTLEETSKIEAECEIVLKTLTTEVNATAEMCTKYSMELEQKTAEHTKLELVTNELRAELEAVKLQKDKEAGALESELALLKEESAAKQLAMEQALCQRKLIEMELLETFKSYEQKERDIEALNTKILTSEISMREVLKKKDLELEQEQTKAIGLASQLENVSTKLQGWNQKWEAVKETMNSNVRTENDGGAGDDDDKDEEMTNSQDQEENKN